MFIYFQGIASFVTLAEAAGICIAVSEKILRRAEDADYDRIIERLSQKSSARGVVMFADEDETRSVLFPPSLSSGPVNIPAFWGLQKQIEFSTFLILVADDVVKSDVRSQS